jgi:hypothetical protein
MAEDVKLAMESFPLTTQLLNQDVFGAALRMKNFVIPMLVVLHKCLLQYPF